MILLGNFLKTCHIDTKIISIIENNFNQKYTYENRANELYKMFEEKDKEILQYIVYSIEAYKNKICIIAHQKGTN